MNLYRNFGNLLENWVAEGYSDFNFQSGAGLDRTDSVSRESVPLSNVKSESEDSGVETISTTSPCHSHQCSGLISEESHPVFDSTEDPPSPSPSISSSSSSCVSLGSLAQKTTCLEVEQALRRTEPSCREKRWTIGPWNGSNTTSFPTSCHPIGSRSHHRFARPRRTHSQPPDPRKAELYRKHLRLRQHGHPVDRQVEQFADGGDQARLDALSPGLLYLEQVCRMLENIAKLQQQNHSLQTEQEILRSQQAQIQCVSLHEEEIGCPASQHLESHECPASEATFLKEPAGFRHRSASDTQAINRHRRSRFVRDEQIADVLVEEPEDKDPLPEIEHKKSSRIQKLKFTSFRKQETHQSDGESNSLQTKKKTKLSNMFRRRMTTRL